MRGTILGISGPTVTVDVRGLKLYDMVFVGRSGLTGEVVRIEADRAIVQVYEDTQGLAVGEPVEGTGMPLTVRLGPGLLSGIFDGLQRPLQRLQKESGPFIRHGKRISALDDTVQWTFHPLKQKGDKVFPGESIGYVYENALKHYIQCHLHAEGCLRQMIDTPLSLDTPVAILENEKKIFGSHAWPVRVPRPYRKKLAPTQPLVTGQRCIDFLFTIAKGGTAILPGGFGTGKTILEQSIAKFADVDIVVYVGCGERGNEMAELIEEFESLQDPWTQRKLMGRTVLIVNTSNMPVAAREASIYTAVTIAEYYRDMGLHVLLLADSISRWAEALREISSSLEEMPGEEGYPTYIASRLASFIERAGPVETLQGTMGAISMILSVSPPGGDLTEPVTQACLRAAGAFLMLDTSLAHRRHFPAIHWFQSYSLYGNKLIGQFRTIDAVLWETAQLQCREILQKEETLREITEIVGIEGLQDEDRLLMHVAEIIQSEFLCQNAYTDDAFSTPEATLRRLSRILNYYNDASNKLKAGVGLDDVLKEN